MIRKCVKNNSNYDLFFQNNPQYFISYFKIIHAIYNNPKYVNYLKLGAF